MTYKEAQEHSLKVEWKTTICQSGEQCWCRIIEPKEKIEDSDGEEIYITPSGNVSRIHAEHIVELHNKSLK